MRDFFIHSLYVEAVLTIAAYLLGRYLHRRTEMAIANPMIIAFTLVIGVICLFNLDYVDYVHSSAVIDYFLTPATVCLAIPLYEKIPVLARNTSRILIAVFMGVAANLIGILALASLFILPPELSASLLPKSVTMPIGLGLSQEIGGIVALTTASIVIAGNFGYVVADSVFKIFKITDPVARGLALGNASHAIGTARALEYGTTEGAFAALAIPLAGLFTVLLAPFFAALL